MVEKPGDQERTCRLIRNEAALIVAAEGAVFDVLGWTAEELVGCASTTFIHPEDQASAVAAWFLMIDKPGSTGTWRGRYRASDGTWRWVESENTNHLDDSADPRVISSIRQATAEQVGIEEELRSRKQLLSRLSDALPVGIFEIDRGRHVTFTNDRLHIIIETPAAATVDAQFAALHDDDRDRLDAALAAALADDFVDDLEVRFLLPTVDDETRTRVCLLSLRSLTDSTNVVTGAVGCLSDVTDSVRLRHELQVRANVDALTGCLNRGATIELLDLALRDRSGSGGGLAVIFVDLNNFKHVNDQHGHAAGDAVLLGASERMQSQLRRDDRIGRIGGDEFLVICPDVPSLQRAIEIADRLRAALDGTVSVGGHSINVRAAIGLAWTNADMSPDALIAEADQAMYAAKKRAKQADPLVSQN